MGELMAAMRDCSSDARQRRGRTGVRFHAIVVKDGHKVLACGDGLPIDDTEEPASGLLPSEKCQRSGCRQAFAKEPTP